MNVSFAQALKQIIAQCQKDFPALFEVFEMRNGKENRDHCSVLHAVENNQELP